MAAIRTLTMNPTVDETWELDRLEPTGKNRARVRTLVAGGGGINVARGVGLLGGAAHAVHTAGRDVGRRLGRLLDEEGLDHVAVEIAEETREAIILLVTEPGDTYHVVPAGPDLTDQEGERCLAAFLDGLGDGAYAVLSGSLPGGLDTGFYGQVARRVRRAGGRVVLDTSGDAVQPALDAGVFLVKPNKREAAELIGRAVSSFDDARGVGERFLDAGAAEVVVTTLGGEGALCSTADGHAEIHNPPLPREALGDAGAGDSLVAGIVHALADGADPVAACAAGVAAGAASVITPGTELFRPEEAAELRSGVEIRR